MKILAIGNRLPVLRLAFPLTTIAAMCFAFLPLTRAIPQPPDGGYPGANTAEGTSALFSLTTGVWNTAIGFEALRSNSTGNTNTALGLRALSQNLDGGGNTAAGSQALLNSTGSRNAALGAQAGVNVTTGSDNIEIANGGVATDDKVIRIGRRNVQENTFIAGIYGRIVPSAFQVVIDANGHLGTVINPSSARFKEQIKPMGNVSEAILALKPVTFRYKKELDPEGLPEFGLVAEEVEKVSPNLIKRDAAGKPESVRYEAVNAMLLNEFLKEHSKVEQLEATGAEQAKEIKALSAALKEQAAQIQKVSARLELDNPAPRTVLNNQ